jgi:20S proteasome alpha/beta subunit
MPNEKLLDELINGTISLGEYLIAQHTIAGMKDTPRIAPNFEEAKKIINKATTVISALHGEGGAFIACDRYATIMSPSLMETVIPIVHKVAILDDDLACGVAGSMSMAMELLVVAELEFYNALKRRDGKPLPLATKVFKIASFLRQFAPLAMQGGPFATPLLVGYERKEKKFKILELDPMGMTIDWTYKGHHTMGSGRSGMIAQKSRIDKAGKHPDQFTREQALEDLILYPLLHTYEADPGSGFDMHRDVWPLVIEVTAAGASFIPKEEVKERVLHIVSTLPKTRDERR